MAPSSQTTEQEPIFGLMQGFVLGTLLLLSAFLAVPMQKMGWSQSVSGLVPATVPVSGILWLVELGAYTAIAGLLARNILVALSGPVLGLITRIIVSMLMAMLISGPLGRSFPETLLHMDRDLWPFRLLAVVMTGAMFLIPLRRMFQSGYGFLTPPPSAAKPSGKAKQFSFTNKAPRSGHYQVVRSGPGTHAAPAAPHAPSAPRPHTAITPPEGITPVIPRDDVFGTVTVPASVILASVPEAAPFLEADKPVTIHLAYLVPQLSRCTAWLLWQQIFSAPGGGARSVNEGSDAGVKDRWVKIPPKYFAAQVPRGYLETQRIPPAWMRLPEVPQERQFHIDQ